MNAVGSLAEPIAGYTDDMAIETREGVDNRYKGADQASRAAPTGEGKQLSQSGKYWQWDVDDAEQEANKKFWATYGGGI